MKYLETECSTKPKPCDWRGKLLQLEVCNCVTIGILMIPMTLDQQIGILMISMTLDHQIGILMIPMTLDHQIGILMIPMTLDHQFIIQIVRNAILYRYSV